MASGGKPVSPRGSAPTAAPAPSAPAAASKPAPSALPTQYPAPAAELPQQRGSTQQYPAGSADNLDRPQLPASATSSVNIPAGVASKGGVTSEAPVNIAAAGAGSAAELFQQALATDPPGRGKYCRSCWCSYSDCLESGGSGTRGAQGDASADVSRRNDLCNFFPGSSVAGNSPHGSAGIASSAASGFCSSAHRKFGAAKWQPGFSASGSGTSGYNYAAVTGRSTCPRCRATSADSSAGSCADSCFRAGSTAS